MKITVRERTEDYRQVAHEVAKELLETIKALHDEKEIVVEGEESEIKNLQIVINYYRKVFSFSTKRRGGSLIVRKLRNIKPKLLLKRAGRS